MNSSSRLKEKINIGIIGGAGYTGGELVRLLLGRDDVQILFVQSRSQAGQLVSSVHTDLSGITELRFIENAPLSDPKLEAVFLALPHGETKKYLDSNPMNSNVRIIDLSNDFRLKNDSKIMLQGEVRHFVYGLPELNREVIRSSRSISNPGCFATAMELALLPLAKAKKLRDVSVTGITGSTGAGQKPTASTHFSFRANNVQAYKTLNHQHLAEVQESLVSLQGNEGLLSISFIPWRGDFTRGIFLSAVTSTDLSQNEALALYQDFYRTEPFVTVTDQSIDLKSVVNTNRALIEVLVSGGKLVVHTAIDNLLKGASGQAVQNFNLMFGLPEQEGLRLKGSAF
jgi:N-acetyl-gamma-glutamyl-phosphate reductase